MANNKVVLGSVTIIDISDTTAVAEDVAQGKEFYGADGNKVVGTASGGITPTGTLSITENGTYDVTNYANADVNVSGGGGMTETLLWENPNPSSALSSELTINLGESLANYDYVHVFWNAAASGSDQYEEYISTEKWKSTNLTSEFYYLANTSYARGLRLGGTRYNIRRDQLIVGTIRSIGSSSTPASTFVIPTKIYGVKL